MSKNHSYSYTELNELYFWTTTIKNWSPLLLNDDFKNIIIESLQWLCNKQLVRIYGYVIMPNHLHLLWTQLKMNGREFPKDSFEKFTSHQFKLKLQNENPDALKQFAVEESDRQYNFWLRNPFPVQILSREMALQKLDYIHYNPMQGRWNLCSAPENYRYSSAVFYESGYDEFNFLTHVMDDL